jgi:hypothetical protein
MPTENEKYLMSVTVEAEGVAKALKEAVGMIEQSEKDERPAYTNPMAAINIKKKTPEYIKRLIEILNALIKEYGPNKITEGVKDTIKRLYRNLENASKYLSLPGVQEEIRKSAYEMLKTLPEND